MWRVRFLAPIFVSCTSPGAGPDVCPNKRHSLPKEVQREDQPVLRAQGQVVLICRGGDHVYVQLMAVHMSSRPLVGTCWVSDLFLTSHGSPPIKTASNYTFMIFTHSSHLKSEHHWSIFNVWTERVLLPLTYKMHHCTNKHTPELTLVLVTFWWLLLNSLLIIDNWCYPSPSMLWHLTAKLAAFSINI